MFTNNVSMDKKIPLYKMYSQRENFVIVALTGITGSGCSKFADMMSMNFEQWQGEKMIRPIEATPNRSYF